MHRVGKIPGWLVLLAAALGWSAGWLPAPGWAAREAAEPQFTIQIVPRPNAPGQGGKQGASSAPEQKQLQAITRPVAPRPAAPAPKSSEGSPPAAASEPAKAPAATPSAPPAALTRIEQALGLQRDTQAREAQLRQALDAVRLISVQAAGPEAYSVKPYVYVDYGSTPKGQVQAQAEARHRERALLLQTLKEHVPQLELQDCLLVETKPMYDYRFIRRANLSRMDAYDLTYTRESGSGFSFTLHAADKDAVILEQQRGGKQLSEHTDSALVFHTSITDGMQAFVLKQRLQELINRCKLGDSYKARSNLPEQAVAPAVRVEPPARPRKLAP